MTDTEPRDERALEPLTAALERFAPVHCHTAIAEAGGWQLTFNVDQIDEGWLTVEFLAWWVRDLNRGGNEVRFYPRALPPWLNGPGRVLWWVLDGDDLGPAGAAVELLAASLERLHDEVYEDSRDDEEYEPSAPHEMN